MAIRYSYHKASLEGVGKALTNFFTPLEGKENSFNRAANANLILPLSSAANLEAVEEEIDMFSRVHPSRFFIIYLDESLKSLEVEVSARCHLLSKTEHVCSDIIRIACPSGKMTAVPSLIRANLLTDMPTEFYISDANFPFDFLRALSKLGETIILDSGDFEGRFDKLDQLEGLVSTALDLQWVGLGLWRDEVKDLFSRPLIREYARSVRAVDISSSSAAGVDGAAASLLGAWIIERLGYSREIEYGPQGFLCSDGLGRSLRLTLHTNNEPGTSKLTELVFHFDPLLIGTSAQDQYIRLSRHDEALETMVDLNVSYRTSRQFDNESRQSRIQRYFLIGESTTNYTAASRLALQFERLRRSQVKI